MRVPAHCCSSSPGHQPRLAAESSPKGYFTDTEVHQDTIAPTEAPLRGTEHFHFRGASMPIAPRGMSISDFFTISFLHQEILHPQQNSSLTCWSLLRNRSINTTERLKILAITTNRNSGDSVQSWRTSVSHRLREGYLGKVLTVVWDRYSQA